MEIGGAPVRFGKDCAQRHPLEVGNYALPL